MIELNLKAAPVIDKYDWEVLSCLDRTLATVSYTLYGEVFWNFVLCKYTATDNLRRRIDVKIGDKKYYDDICKRAGLELALSKLSRNGAFDFIIKNLSAGAYPIYIINDKKRPGSKHYQVKNHGFFVLIYGYDEASDEFLTYDLPLDKEFWKTENNANGIVYERQRIKRQTLFSYSDRNFLPRYEILETVTGINTGDFCSCFILKDNHNPSMEAATELLATELKSIIADHDEHKKYVEALLGEFLKAFDTRYSAYTNIRLDDIQKIEEKDTEGVKSLLFYPYEWQVVCWHEAHIKMLKKTLPFIGLPVSDGLEALFGKHQMIRLELIKGIIRHDVVGLAKTTAKVAGLLDDAVICYGRILEDLRR